MEFIIKGLYKKYDKKEVLKGIDFTFEEGKIYALLGRNGAGKTLMSMRAVSILKIKSYCL